MIIPFGNRVLIKRLTLPETTASGLYILGRDYPTLGHVVAVGNGARSKQGYRRLIWDVRPGDLVHFNWREAHLDTRQVGPDLFLLDYECLETAISDHGLTFPR